MGGRNVEFNGEEMRWTEREKECGELSTEMLLLSRFCVLYIPLLECDQSAK